MTKCYVCKKECKTVRFEIILYIAEEVESVIDFCSTMCISNYNGYLWGDPHEDSSKQIDDKRLIQLLDNKNSREKENDNSDAKKKRYL